MITITSPCDALLDESNDSRHDLSSARPEYTGIIMSTTREEESDDPDLRKLLNVEPSTRYRDSTDQSKINISEIPKKSLGEGIVCEDIAKRGLLDFTGGRVGHLVYKLYIVWNPPLGDLSVEVGF